VTFVGIGFTVLGLVLSVCFSLALRSPICIALFLYHLSAALFNWNNSLTNPADSTRYYAQVADFSQFKPGTRAVEWFAATLRDLLDASFLDLYMVFHLFGYLGAIRWYQLCKRTLEPTEGPQGSPSLLLYIVCFLPGLHVWSSVLGKDELVFLAITSFLWGLAEPTRRFLSLAFGLGLCCLVRPHVAALLSASCAIAAIVSGGLPLLWRILVSGGLLFGLRSAFPFLSDFLGVNSLDVESSTDFVQRWQSRNLEGGSSVDISDYSFPFQVFTYLYRPLFFDANGFLGIVVSVENLLLLAITLLCAPSLIRALSMERDRFFLRFNLLFWGMTTAILASTTTNLGNAIRQKIMVLPSLLTLLLAAYATRALAAREAGEETTEPEEATEAEVEAPAVE